MEKIGRSRTGGLIVVMVETDTGWLTMGIDGSRTGDSIVVVVEIGTGWSTMGIERSRTGDTIVLVAETEGSDIGGLNMKGDIGGLNMKGSATANDLVVVSNFLDSSQ